MQSDLKYTFGHNIKLPYKKRDKLLPHQLKHKDLCVAQAESDALQFMKKNYMIHTLGFLITS